MGVSTVVQKCFDSINQWPQNSIHLTPHFINPHAAVSVCNILCTLNIVFGLWCKNFWEFFENFSKIGSSSSSWSYEGYFRAKRFKNFENQAISIKKSVFIGFKLNFSGSYFWEFSIFFWKIGSKILIWNPSPCLNQRLL